MSAWKEILHDELGGLTRTEQARILVAHGWTEQDAYDMLERQHVFAREEVTSEDNTDIDQGQRLGRQNRSRARRATEPPRR